MPSKQTRVVGMWKLVLSSLTVLGIASSISSMAMAAQFSFDFEWGGIKRCTTGRPNTVPNPIFHLRNVPEGTDNIHFEMKDLDVPSFRHGGGTVKYAGEGTINPGAFTYLSPCPPSGRHTYEWTATALDASATPEWL